MHPLFRRPSEFIAGAATLSALPPMGLPEVALIGRSNVGKSSLVNALVGQNALARTSQRPGATRQLNFFSIAQSVVLVDMPGYGFAKVSKQERAQWDALIRGYLTGRANLKRVLVLIDARRSMMPPDEEMLAMLDEAAVSYQLVATKADLLSEKEASALLQNLRNALHSHPAAHPQILITSATHKRGIEALQEEIIGLIA